LETGAAFTIFGLGRLRVTTTTFSLDFLSLSRLLFI